MMIYFDNSATTKIDPEVIEAMLPYIREQYGNPSSKYYTLAQNTQKAVEEARASVAQLLGCDFDEVIFTSGSTESNNFILKGITDYYGNTLRKKILTSKAEHASILDTAKYLQSKGFDLTYLDVDRFGRINPSQVEDILTTEDEKPLLVSIIWGNNELGSLNDITSIARLCANKNVFFHTDATQIIGKHDIRMSERGIHFLSCSAHKIHGPKGVGACILRKDELGIRTNITPLLHGGGQEHNYRSGTLGVHNIVGFGKAAEIAKRNFKSNVEILERLENYLKKSLITSFAEQIKFNNDDKDKLPGILSVQFIGVNNERLIKRLSSDVAISTGSACSSTKPSHILASIGLDSTQIKQTIRISLSKFNTIKEIDDFVHYLNNLFT